MKNKQSLNQINLPIIFKGKLIKDKDSNEKTSKSIVLAFIIFLIILLLFCGYSLAKTVEDIIIKNNTPVAEPILTIENTPEMEITASQNYGIYTFKIKNYNENDKITDVNLKYCIELIYEKDDALNIELYQDENKIELKDNKTEYIEISKDKKEDREYQVKITYNKEKNNETAEIADIMQKMQVKIHTEQVKA